MNDVFFAVYREIKAMWNKLRQTNTDPEILRCLVKLLDMMEEAMDEEEK